MNIYYAQDNKGLTLIELMIVMVLSLVLMAAVYMAYQAQHKTSSEQQQVSAVQQDLRAVMNIMAKDIRNTGCDPLNKNSFGIQDATLSSNSLDITYDLSKNGTTDAKQSAYTLAGNQIQRNGTTLVNNVTTLEFVYIDADDAEITDTTAIADVRSIQVQVSIQSPDKTFTRTLTRRIKCRNLGL
ncbi:MAG: prepilin-type N-terminal cleavage/methylation domain-containing protein [Thermodesulfobacteriota bacterium]|nr:prepilin-type N-terminal cleavage/methylation domain-containing protein [Thermodesulfobacteriota bacterium]